MTYIPGGASGSTAWADITGKPSTFPPEAHTQAIAAVTGLQTALDGMQPLATVLTNTTAAFTTAQQTKLSGIATGATANTGTVTSVGGTGTVSGLTLTGTVTGAGNLTLGGTLAAASTNITDFTEASQDIIGAMVTAAGGSYNDAAGTITLPAGGVDPWTYIKLAGDFTTTSATAVDITGLAFTPAANTTYEFECLLLTRTATTTVGPRPGIAWPTGGTDGGSDIYMPTAATTQVMAFGNVNAAILAAVGGLPNTTRSYPARVAGVFVAGASPAGSVRMQLASETAGTTVTAKAGSFLKYRTI